MVLLYLSITNFILHIFNYYVGPICQNLPISLYPFIPQNCYIFMLTYRLRYAGVPVFCCFNAIIIIIIIITIVTVFKNGGSTVVNNYRLISILNNFSNILKFIVYDHLYCFLSRELILLSLASVYTVPL
jgi:hypothetical protein